LHLSQSNIFSYYCLADNLFASVLFTNADILLEISSFFEYGQSQMVSMAVSTQLITQAMI